MDWQVGDLALCLLGGPVDCPTHNIKHTGKSCPPLHAIREVVAVGRSERATSGSRCHCVTLRFASGENGLALRFRKIRPDEREACEPEFVTLLENFKRKVSA